MEFKPLGKSDIQVPAIGMGTWGIGEYRRGKAYDRAWIQALRRGIELGMTLIDTAEIYGRGRSEEVVGEAIRGRREDVFVATKVWHTHLSYDDVLRAAEASLRRLDIDCIDLYQVHWPNPSIPISETMKAMERLVGEGKIRFIGVSNFPVDLLKEAQEALRREDVVSNQVKYSLLDRGVERDLLPHCQKERVTVIAYSPLERGRIFGLGGEVGAALREAAERMGKTVSQIALNWLIAKPGVVAIPKAARMEHIKENASVGGWRLPEDILETIEGVFQA